MNPTVGDYAANTRKIIAWMREADSKKSDLLVFPEMSLCGYPVWDLANKKRFVEQGLKHLELILRESRGKKITAVLGAIAPSAQSSAKNFNAMYWIQNGKIIHRYFKQLLPTYDVFLEGIFFQPGKESRVFKWRSLKIGNTICEDIWDEKYSQKPMREFARQGMRFAINISASPFYLGVPQVRENLLIRHARAAGVPILYVNQVGGQDDLIFDGRSLLVDARGKVLLRAPAFREGLFYYDLKLNQKQPFVPKSSDLPIHEVYDALVLGVRDYCKKNNFKKVVIGLSGGIDSALVAAIARDALGANSVLGITMPGLYSSKGSWKDAGLLAKNLGIEFRIYPIKNKYQALLHTYERQKKKNGIPPAAKGSITTAMENLQARLRGLELMYVSNDEGCLLLTTGNKSELAMGYCTLYGDMAGGLSVIGDVYKTDVYRLAEFRNSLGAVIPRSTMMKPPSAELRPNQKDEDSLPKYSVLDSILRLYIEKNHSREEIISELSRKKISASLIMDVIRKVDHNEYKRRQTPPILRVTEKAWFGRRMPITNRFES